MKKALIFDPYLDTLGGGERYILTFAQVIADLGYSVDLAWKDEKEIKQATDRFGLDLSKIILNKEAYKNCTSKLPLQKKYFFTRKYDLIFWVSDGSLPFLFGKNNLVHFQVPFRNLGGSVLSNKLKLTFINKLVYNSDFTRKVIEKSLPKSKGVVLYPPIDTNNFRSGNKENIILSVARFDSPSHSKRQDILVEAFSEFNSQIKGYKLILTGGHRGDKHILNELKRQAGDLPVEIIPNLDFSELQKLYARSKFFWHAAGFGIDEDREPEKVEHFGMTTVEAMSAGCIPIVIAKGGQKETVTDNSGFLVNSPSEMADITASLTRDKRLETLPHSAIQRAEEFSIQSFTNKISRLIS